MKEKTKKELLDRVKRAKKFIKFHNDKNSKNLFFDTCYGAMYKAESTKIDNLWAGKTTDEEFTANLEKYAENPNSFTGDEAQIARFMKFVSWYTRTIGGQALTKEQITEIFPKFKV